MSWLGVFLTVLYTLCNSSVQGQTIFIGHGTTSHYFAVKSSPNHWDWGMNNCHSRQLMPGSIPTELDHTLITYFLNTSTQIGDENRFLWLAATDHKQEGTFQWLWNSEEVNVGSWVPGMPSMNRAANCLAINRNGQFFETPCSKFGDFFVLCEASKFFIGKPPIPGTQQTVSKLSTHIQSLSSAPFALTVIGQVGNRMYFTDDGWVSSPIIAVLILNVHTKILCMAQEGEPNPIYYLGGTDRLSLSCLKSNKEFYWFYSGNPVANQTLSGDTWYYQCVYVTPHGMTNSACATGAGAGCHPICEITV